MTTKVYVVDLRSDTVTKPTEAMKYSIINSELGDDVYGEDPTVNMLEKKIAALLNKEAALFLPTGTMSNLIATMVHCNKRGAEIICGDLSHVVKYEQGNTSSIAQVMVRTLKNREDGTFDLNECERAIRGSDYHEPRTTLITVENTHNYCGGKVLPLEWLDGISALAKKYSLKLHMDGARLFNAAVSMNEDVARIVRDFDSVSVCFSKGLCAPAGSALIGSNKLITEARRFRKALGGGMRQSGVLAAAALVALDENITELAADHRRAGQLAKAINDFKLPSFYVDVANQQTNMVMLKISTKAAVTGPALVRRLSELNKSELLDDPEPVILKTFERDEKSVRFVLHFDIDDELLKLAIKKLKFVLNELEGLVDNKVLSS